MVSVWEDESITFDALQNDYLTGGNICKHPRIFTAGSWFTTTVWKALPIYTPYKGFAGNDSFSYTISDVNSNLASGAVNISIISIPPQFVSIPNQLHAIEDLISPIFGGFSGIEILYSDLKENISVILIARSGTVLLSPMLMQFWQPMWSELSVSKGDGKGEELKIEGRLEVINFALQSIQ